MYVDYEFYSNDFHGSMTEDEFYKIELKAESYIRYFLFLSASVMDGEPIASIQNAVCAVADVLNAYYKGKKVRETQGMGIGLMVKGETNDGYSVTYTVEKADGETEEIYLRKKAYDAAYMYLLSSGHLIRRIGCSYGCECGYNSL